VAAAAGRTNSGGGGGGDGDSLKLTTAAGAVISQSRLTTAHLLSHQTVLHKTHLLTFSLCSMESTFLCHPVLAFFLGHT